MTEPPDGDDHAGGLTAADADLVADLLAGEQRALARVLSKIENRTAGARAILSALYPHTGSTPILGITGTPGAGKSTLVDTLTARYREADETVGILAVDPASPYTGGSVLGDRIRMGSAAGDPGVFIRSMSARGQLGGLAAATADAAVALDAFGFDRLLIETVGAGQNEVDVVELADTVAVVVQPGAGDDVQLLKAGILEIGDLFVVNKADRPEAAGTVADLEEMVHLRHAADGGGPVGSVGHHGAGEHHGAAADDAAGADDDDAADAAWTPPVLETVAMTGRGVDDFRAAVDDHLAFLDRGGTDERRRRRAELTVQRLLRGDLGALSDRLLAAHGGAGALAAAIARRETDPYTVVDDLLDPIADAVDASVDADDSTEPAADDLGDGAGER